MQTKTIASFDRFRNRYGTRLCRKQAANMDEELQIARLDGLLQWIDGPSTASKNHVPTSSQLAEGACHLWAVRPQDVVHAEEFGATGLALTSLCLKHSNLTGGDPAHCAGELIMLGDDVVALNGASGRYGPGSSDEMDAVAEAFHASGYGVWNYGFDTDIGVPFRFEAGIPVWVK